MKTIQTIGSLMLVLLLATAAAPSTAMALSGPDDKDKKKDKKGDNDSGADIYAGASERYPDQRPSETTGPYIIMITVAKPKGGKVSEVNGIVTSKSAFEKNDQGEMNTISGAFSPKSGEIKGKWKGAWGKGVVDGDPLPGGFKVTITQKDGRTLVFPDVTKVGEEADGAGDKAGERESGGKQGDKEGNEKPEKPEKPDDKGKAAGKPEQSKPAHKKPPTGAN